MDCDNISYDNRETCVFPLPSSCVPYTGVINESIKAAMPACKPNINDVLKALQELIDKIKADLGNNKDLDKKCLDITPATVTQQEINQVVFDEICEIKSLMPAAGGTIDPSTISIAINLLCLLEPSCEPQETYTLLEILNKLVTAYCNLLTRVTNIETILNI